MFKNGAFISLLLQVVAKLSNLVPSEVDSTGPDLNESFRYLIVMRIDKSTCSCILCLKCLLPGVTEGKTERMSESDGGILQLPV